MANETTVCLGCSKKFTKSDYALQCTVCALWIHKSCSGVSDEVFKVLDDQFKSSGTAYWACRPCTSYAKGINHRMKQIEDRLGKVETETKTTTDKVKKTEQQLEKITSELAKNDKKMERAVEKGESSIFEEMRERESRKLNVVIYGLEEHENISALGRDRLEWDLTSCVNIFEALEADLTKEEIKFCRRIGEKGEEPRPLVLGFFTDTDRSQLMRKARFLRGSEFDHVSVAPDLTRRQRQEEGDLWTEAERRNKDELTNEDVAKNLVWLVVGPRGEKRLIKTTPRETPARGRGQSRGTRGYPGGHPPRRQTNHNQRKDHSERPGRTIEYPATEAAPRGRGQRARGPRRGSAPKQGEARETRQKGTNRGMATTRGGVNRIPLGVETEEETGTEDGEYLSGDQSEEETLETTAASRVRKRKDRPTEDSMEMDGPPAEKR